MFHKFFTLAHNYANNHSTLVVSTITRLWYSCYGAILQCLPLFSSVLLWFFESFQPLLILPLIITFYRDFADIEGGSSRLSAPVKKHMACASVNIAAHESDGLIWTGGADCLLVTTCYDGPNILRKSVVKRPCPSLVFYPKT